jgi:hypothetical protein
MLAIAGAVLVGAGGALVGGCGGGPDFSDLSTFCQALAQADCSQPVVTGCYGSSSAMLAADTKSCVTAAATPERCNPMNLDYHPQYAQGCIDAHTAAYMSGQIDAASLATMVQQCLPVLNQGGEAGTPCAYDSDCDVGAGNFCVVHQSGAGTCQVPETVMPGGSCAKPAAQCTAGYFCQSSGYCVVDPDQAGQACGAGVSCNTGLSCKSETMTCAAQVPDGASCTADSDCTGGLCVSVPGGGQCAAMFTFAVGSAACSSFLPK